MAQAAGVNTMASNTPSNQGPGPDNLPTNMADSDNSNDTAGATTSAPTTSSTNTAPVSSGTPTHSNSSNSGMPSMLNCF